MRLPGDVSSTSQLWDLLIEGRSTHGGTPSSRYNSSSFYHPNPEQPGGINSEGGYFINEDPRLFDNGFFGINNMEAKYMDPQQRKLLEVVFESFENAGVSLDDISDSKTGCYVANFTFDYYLMQSKDAEAFHRYSATGMGNTILANRVSHVFNMKGPSLVLDTACSSSIYSLHVACAALRSGECDAAVVAGANLIQSPESHQSSVKAGILSGTSTCHTFDSSADGYGRAEGVGALYIKKLSRAIQDGDPIRCVIRGSAVNRSVSMVMTVRNDRNNRLTFPVMAKRWASRFQVLMDKNQ
jgi:acyl transferase domain-containing protein